MPKQKKPLPSPKTQPRRKPSGGTSTRSRADAAVDVGKTLREEQPSRARRTALQRLAGDAASGLERYRVRPAGAATGLPKKKSAPQQLKVKARSAARQNKDAPRRA